MTPQRSIGKILLLWLAVVLYPSLSFAPVATPFLANGGRVSWYKGPAAHDLIAFDAVVDAKTLSSEVYTINPDRTDPVCVTCNAPFAKGFVGQADWHPDGEHLVIQVENENSAHIMYNHTAWGIDNDLWVIRRDGTGAERIWATPRGHAALHPHFSNDGTKLMFAERVPLETGPQNPWDNWRIRIADVDLSQQGSMKLHNVDTITPNGRGFYETHEFAPGGRIVYSHTPGGLGYVDDVYSVNLDGSDPVNLLNSPDSWDEFGYISPLNGAIAFISSRFDPDSGSAATLRTELYVALPGGTPQRVTFYNRTDEDKFIVKDLDWDRTGTRIVYLLWGAQLRSPQLWMLSFP
jgi:Tol biopolymer transport system component